MKKPKINPEEMFQALATSMTKKARESLRDSVRLPENPTESQKAYAENVKKSADNVFIQAWVLGVRDDQWNIKEAERKLIEAAKNRSVLKALKKDPKSGL